MRFSPILLLHIYSGIVGVLSGFAAGIFRKGSRQHVVAGDVFVMSMLTLAASGVYMAAMKSQPGNVLGGTLTGYLVVTSWMTAKRRTAGTDLLDWGTMIVGFAVAATTMTLGLQGAMSPTGLVHGDPAGQYFFLGFVAMLAVVGDVGMLVRGGISGAKRIARHLWRMCFALFIAAGSIFLARQHLFPKFMRQTGSLYVLSFLPLILMVYWLVRTLFSRQSRRKPVAPAVGHISSLRSQSA